VIKKEFWKADVHIIFPNLAVKKICLIH
jgi:hypothetical protein